MGDPASSRFSHAQDPYFTGKRNVPSCKAGIRMPINTAGLSPALEVSEGLVSSV